MGRGLMVREHISGHTGKSIREDGEKGRDTDTGKRHGQMGRYIEGSTEMVNAKGLDSDGSVMGTTTRGCSNRGREVD